VFLSEVANDRGDGYRAKALELHARAEVERSPLLKTEFESLAAAYLRLAEQAERMMRSLLNSSLPFAVSWKAITLCLL
jgi:hypothetical protein